MSSEPVRCGWLNNDPLYIDYHDNEWGIPEFDSQKLFELLCLEGQQAGLAWITILKKRENYKRIFLNFNPYEIEQLGDSISLQNILSDTGIVRHKGKIHAIINNAKCLVKMDSKYDENFSNFIWKFVDYKPIINNWMSDKEVPSETEISRELSRSLKQRGFKYVGSKICYAFMQASGLVNDHIVDCICRIK